MDCGENSKQNLWYLTLHCCILSQNALIPAFLAHKKCGDDAKTTTWYISPAFPGPTHSVRLWGGGWKRGGGGGGGGMSGAHSLFHHSQHSDTSHKYNLQVPVSFLQQYNNVRGTGPNLQARQYFREESNTSSSTTQRPNFHPSARMFFYFSGGCIAHRSSWHSFPSQALPTQ